MAGWRDRVCDEREPKATSACFAPGYTLAPRHANGKPQPQAPERVIEAVTSEWRRLAIRSDRAILLRNVDAECSRSREIPELRRVHRDLRE
jgi:hypothetical protein